jgi:hypothetical protein
MIWLISGSRKFPNEWVARAVFEECFDLNDTVVHGGAVGVDTWADSEAKSAGCIIEVYKPDWSTYGKAAGPIRNEHMVKYVLGKADVKAIVCWDGKSKGTEHMLKLLQLEHIPYILIQEEHARTS